MPRPECNLNGKLELQSQLLQELKEGQQRLALEVEKLVLQLKASSPGEVPNWMAEVDDALDMICASSEVAAVDAASTPQTDKQTASPESDAQQTLSSTPPDVDMDAANAPRTGTERASAKSVVQQNMSSASHALGQMLKASMSRNEKEENTLWGKLMWFERHVFDLIIGVIIVANSVTMIMELQYLGAEADYALGLVSTKVVAPDYFPILDQVFLVIYALEVIVRVAICGRHWFYSEEDGLMLSNVLDLFIVLAGVLEVYIWQLLFADGDNEILRTAMLARLLRLLRVLKVVRVMRVASLVQPLRILVRTIVVSSGALVWSLVLLFVLQVFWSVLLCQSLHDFLLRDSIDIDIRLTVNNQFGDFSKSLYTMFEITYSGGAWPTIVRPIVEKVNVWFSIPFLAYIVCVVFAVIRIISALFIKETLNQASSDYHIRLLESNSGHNSFETQVKALFAVADDTGDGVLTREELHKAMSHKIIKNYMHLLEVHADDVNEMFDMLDDGDGRVTISEFCDGLKRLKGQAREMDLIAIRRDFSRFHHMLVDLKQHVKMSGTPHRT